MWGRKEKLMQRPDRLGRKAALRGALSQFDKHAVAVSKAPFSSSCFVPVQDSFMARIKWNHLFHSNPSFSFHF
jgi:hypothetical protein